MSGEIEAFLDDTPGEVRGMVARDGRFEPKDLETPLLVLREFNTDVANADIDLEKTYTNAFVDRVAADAKQ